jgi:hypothetical protein
MKTIAFILAFGLLLLAISCKRNPEPYLPIRQANAAEVKGLTPPAITPAIEEALRQKGQAIAAQGFGVLSSRLRKAIADAGLTNAIEFCSVHGITFTA